MPELSQADRDFVAELKTFIADNLDPETRAVVEAGGHPTKAQMTAWQRALASRNWLIYTWSAEHGGPGFTPLRQFLFEQTLAEMHAPGNNGLEIKMAGPVIREFGNAEQKARHLPGIMQGTVNWCQGYSEPGAGSDLASLATRADIDGDDYIVNGQKIWTSYAHWADWMFMLARTSREAKRQSGITFLLVDMKTPGITVRPIVAMDGHHGFNEVFFDNVRVPRANRIGEEGKGWTYAKFLLSNERLGVVSLPMIRHSLQRAEAAVARPLADGSLLVDDATWAARLVDLKVRLRALEGWVKASLDELLEQGRPGVEISMVKIRGTELNQDLAEFTMDALAYDALPYDFERSATADRALAPTPDFGATITAAYLYRRAFTILGGSTEIQKNIVSKAILGL
jgi:alkylation response protein AidB-like acyl-CoA dehydrogenase